jgi:diguanylate cyclase (GGDEF)-like protein
LFYGRKRFFLKKRTKKLFRLGRACPDGTATASSKSFASFLQKRRSFFAPAHTTLDSHVPYAGYARVHLDAWTSLVLLPLVLFLISAGYFLFWVQDRSQAALLWMVGATALPALGYTLRLSLAPVPAVLFGNAVIMAGLAAQWMACRLIAGRRPWWWMLLAAAGFWLAETRLPGFSRDIHIRLIAFNLLSSSLIGLGFLELRRTVAGAARLANLWVSGLLLVQWASQFGWAVLNMPFWSHYPGSAAMTASPGLSYLMVVTVAATMLLSFGIIALVREPAALHYRQAALVDALTGLGNRRRLDEYLDEALRRAGRAGSPLALIMIDVDCFKMYNDRYGHVAGDTCLRAIAGALDARLVRRFDQVMRYGGEEFVAVLPDTGEAAALEIAEKLRLDVRRLALAQAGREGGVVTISAGVAVARGAQHLGAARALLHAADQALYAAKQNGRDQVVAAWGSAPARAVVV